jgi:hypothetical protein
MSRTRNVSRFGDADRSDDSLSSDRTRALETISVQALKLAEHARGVGLTTLSHMLEAAALEAASASAAGREPTKN